jgi:excisionase family DNA binding protein
MEILSPEDRVILWRLAVDSEGQQRTTLLHVLSRELLDALSDLDLYGDYERFVVDSMQMLDDAGLLSRDSVRLAFEHLHERKDGAEALAGELSALLREAAAVTHLDVERRVQAIDLSSAWREHLLTRSRREAEYLTVADIAGMFSVSTQAVYKWLDRGRIVGERRPGGSWRIPAAQFHHADQQRVDEARSRELQKRLLRLHGDEPEFSDDEISAALRDQQD